MFDVFRLKEVLVKYKEGFVSQQWPNEKYKWEAVRCFQDNWDINAPDFADMLTRSLAKTYNLLASMNNFPAKMIQGFAKVAPEEVRAMYIALFDESKDVVGRILEFKNQSSILLEKYGNGAGQHYQYENAVSTYLWLRYPDKYYIYKYGEVKTVADELGSDYRFKKGAYADNLRNFLALYDEIRAELKNDGGLVNLMRGQLTDACYPDAELCTLTIDVGFYISRYYSTSKGNPPTEEVQYNKHTLHSNNLYQIFTYVKNKDSEFGDKPHEVSGMLLYAQTEEAIQPDNTYMMSGNRISVKTLDLNCEFAVLAAQLDMIAKKLIQ